MPVAAEDPAALSQPQAFSKLRNGASGAPASSMSALLGVAASADASTHGASAVPFTSITLVCRDIRYYVPDPSKGKGEAPGVRQAWLWLINLWGLYVEGFAILAILCAPHCVGPHCTAQGTAPSGLYREPNREYKPVLEPVQEPPILCPTTLSHTHPVHPPCTTQTPPGTKLCQAHVVQYPLTSGPGL